MKECETSPDCYCRSASSRRAFTLSATSRRAASGKPHRPPRWGSTRRSWPRPSRTRSHMGATGTSNAIKWKHHLQQESEWDGNMFGKNSDFIGVEQFGAGARRPRAIQDPGSYYEYNDVRINRFSLSLARLFGTSVPDVLKSAIMDPIG